MEIFEILYALLQGCGCLLEVMAFGSTAGTGVAGVKARKNHLRNRAASQPATRPHNVSDLPVADRTPSDAPERKPVKQANAALIAFLILLPFSLLLIALLIARWLKWIH